MTLHLPPHRLQRIHDLLDTTLRQRFTTRHKWQVLLGELRSMTLALHSSVHLFSMLQSVWHQRTCKMHIMKLARQALTDWKAMATDIAMRPVPIVSLVPHAPHYLSATDASSFGMGGWWLPTTLTSDSQPCIWRTSLPHTITQCLVPRDNPHGTLTNNDLELAAAILGHATQLHAMPHQPYTNTYLGTGNVAAQSWLRNGSVSTLKPPAPLLRQLAFDCQHFNSSLSAFHVSGSTNTLADFLSRTIHLSDDQLLHAVQRLAPIQPPWKLVTPPASWVSRMSSALLNCRHVMEFPTHKWTAQTQDGLRGPPSATLLIKTPCSKKLWTQSPY